MVSARLACPSCGQLIDISVDPSVRRQDYVEDCEVCCKPIRLRIVMDAEGEPTIEARGEQE